MLMTLLLIWVLAALSVGRCRQVLIDLLTSFSKQTSILQREPASQSPKH